jgi:hypothetical protein
MKKKFEGSKLPKKGSEARRLRRKGMVRYKEEKFETETYIPGKTRLPVSDFPQSENAPRKVRRFFGRIKNSNVPFEPHYNAPVYRITSKLVKNEKGYLERKMKGVKKIG